MTGECAGELDYTGFRAMSVTLREEVFRPFLLYLVSRGSAEKLRVADVCGAHAVEAVCVSGASGNPDVWSGGFSYTRELKPIKRFKVDEFSVAILEYKTPLVEWSPGSAVYERYNVLSAQRQWLEAQ